MKKQFDPKHIISDFEPELLSATKQQVYLVSSHIGARIGNLQFFIRFSTTSHSGCLFHFRQAIHRQIRSLGLAAGYAQNEDIRTQCRQLMALGVLPIDDLEKQFQRLRAIA